MELTVPRLPTPIPGALSMSEVMPLPAPPPTPDLPSMSYQSMNISQSTIAGHMNAPRLPPGVSMQHQQWPPLMAPIPQASMANSQASLPGPQASMAAPQARPGSRILLILVVAVIASAVGVTLLLAN